jgi:uncharacterized hydrophobic protein (TIGR00271 family)
VTEPKRHGTGAETALLRVGSNDLLRMREQLLFDGPNTRQKLSRFWTLLVLAAVIASAGIVSDSTATVIGAMIVAPLMTPILGSVLSIATGDGRNLVRSLALVIAGALSVVCVGFLIGLVVPFDVVAATSSQVAGRVHPRLIDLVAALATGAVGSFALVRSDVSDTLPGVAIAISLVPPLAVAGITLESNAPSAALGATLLFLTNVAAILLSGLIVMALYRVRRTERLTDEARGGRLSLVVVLGFVVAIAIPLAATSRTITRDAIDASRVQTVATQWATPAGWTINSVDPGSDGLTIHAVGPPPAPSASTLRNELDAAGLDHVQVKLELVPQYTIDLGTNSRNGTVHPRAAASGGAHRDHGDPVVVWPSGRWSRRTQLLMSVRSS